MKLNPEDPKLGILHRGHRGFAARGYRESGRRLENAISMAHPYLLCAIQQRGRPDSFNLPRPIFPAVRRLHFPAELLGHQLHSVANPENRNSHLVHARIACGRARFVYGIRAAGKHDAFRPVAADFLDRRVERKNLGIHVGFANSAADQLCILRTKIQDENRVKR
jgi:hypothetical protein